ncbi:hypothetical protein [Ruminococcus sp. NK3A76]|uniref:hypothetical protein n=1 Tax=Ruminococcus sp. NK3A76 TaxID=877411 RepID=UPI000AA7677F|nr:hypothetical protein [Ruminococcus sp. NK3A76]
MKKISIYIALYIAAFGLCKQHGSYVDIESEKAQQAELISELDTYEFYFGQTDRA